MKRSLIVWGVPGVLYAFFFSWYTSFGGPLTDDEVAHYMSVVESRVGGSSEDTARIRHFLENDTGDDFVMMNIIDMHDTPLVVEGVGPGETSAQVLARYMAYMWPALLSRASHPVIFASAAAESLDVWGIEDAYVWDQGAYMRYRSRRDMMEISMSPEFQGPHEFKIAAMAKTIAFPADPFMYAGDPRLLLALALIIVALLLDKFLPRRS